MSKVFDPIGLVAPFTVAARLLLKDIWRWEHWDEELPKETVDQLLVCCVELSKLADITIPRTYFLGNFKQLELHMFGNFWLEFFRAFAFLRAQIKKCFEWAPSRTYICPGSSLRSIFKGANNYKAGKQAALLAARLKQDICRALTVKFDIVLMCTGCTTVFQWPNSTTKHPIFIANRVDEV